MTLSKHDIAEYYSDPEVRSTILAQLKNRPAMVVNSRPGKTFVRRNTPDGKPIRIQKATGDAQDTSDLAWFTNRRYSEFHPTIGRKTKKIWVDIDPGPQRSLEELKPVVTDVQSIMQRMPGVKDTQISYSGGRGFYVRGDLQRKENTDEVRKRLNERLRELQSGTVVQHKPGGNEVRLDTSTLHNKGSIRADYSINSETGRVAVPLTPRELRGFAPEQADVQRILKEKEFAPGIPRSRRVYALPEGKNPRQWTLAVQQHDARRAGRHWDLRLVDPETGFAHSWAVPRATFPTEAEKILAVRTPTHTAHYALNFGDSEPQTIGKGYGQGTVQIVHKEPVSVEQSSNHKLKFKRIIGDSSGEQFTLFRTKDNAWLLRRDKEKPMLEKVAYVAGYRAALEKLGVASQTLPLEKRRNNQKPVEPSDDNLPAGQLAAVLSNMVTETDDRNSPSKVPITQRSRSEERLNRPTEWSAFSSIPQHFMEGPTPVLSGRF